MATDIGSLQAFVTADNTGLELAARDSIKTLGRLGSKLAASTKRISEGFNRIGRTLTVGVTLPIIAAGAAMLKSASDAEETANKFNVVFSSVANEANIMAESLRNDFGLARSEAKMLLSDTADLLSGFGFTQEAALELSGQVQILAADLASFTNIEGGTKRASDALTKALLGEREMVKSLGIAILDADVKERVLLLTQQGVTFETDRQAKAFATLQLATEQSKNALGDFERSQSSSANQARIFFARVKDIADLLGTALLPPLVELTGKGIELANMFLSLNPELQRTVVHVALIAAAAGPAALGMGLFFKAISLGFAGFSLFSGLIVTIASPLGLIAAAGIAATAVFIGMVGPVDALAVGWEVLEQAWTFWVKQFESGVNFLTKKTGELRIMVVAADVIGKAWVALRTVYSLFSVALGVFIDNVAGGFAKLILSVETAANALGVHFPKSLVSARIALEGLSKAGADFAKDNIEVAAETAKEWDNAFGSMKDSGLAFAGATKEVFSAVKTAGTDILNVLLSESEGKADRLQKILEDLKNSVINIGANLQVSGPEGAGGGPGSSQEKEQLDNSLAAWQEWKTGVGSIWQEWLTEMTFTWENAGKQFGELGVNMADSFADSVGKIIVEGGTFASVMKNLFNSLFAELIALEIKWVIAAVVNSAKRVAIKATETAAVVALDETQVIANAAAAAPVPWLIPVFVAVGLGFFAAALASSGGGGGKGPGSDVTPSSPSAGSSVMPATPDSTRQPGPLRKEATQKVEVTLREARGRPALMAWIIDQADNGAVAGSKNLAITRS